MGEACGVWDVTLFLETEKGNIKTLGWGQIFGSEPVPNYYSEEKHTGRSATHEHTKRKKMEGAVSYN